MIAGLIEVNPEPVRLERPGQRPSVHARSHDLQRLRVEPDPFPFAAGPVTPAERDEDQQDVEAKKREHRPGPERGKYDSYGQAEDSHHAHQQPESGWAE